MGKETKSVLGAGGLFLFIALFAGYFVNSTRAAVVHQTQVKVQLKRKIAALKKEAALRPKLEKELESLKVNLAQYVKILPSPEVATEESLMALIQEKSERSQFEILNYRQAKSKTPRGRRRGRRRKNTFTEIGLTLNAKGSYEQFLRFLNSLERYESFLRVNSFSCAAPTTPVKGVGGKDSWPLRVNLNISTFRYEAGGK